jgi:uncharacterized protein YutE (UPF0331/DUF86 family)
LATLAEHVERARRRRPADVQLFRDDVDLQDSLAMSLLVATQEAVDVAFHIATDEGWGVPASYADAFALLARRGVIHGALADELGRVVGVRNRVAHLYGTVDFERLWREIPIGMDALDRFASAVARFLAKESEHGDS